MQESRTFCKSEGELLGLCPVFNVASRSNWLSENPACGTSGKFRKPALYTIRIHCYIPPAVRDVSPGKLLRGVIGSTTVSGTVSWGSSPYGVISSNETFQRPPKNIEFLGGLVVCGFAILHQVYPTGMVAAPLKWASVVDCW